MASSYYPPHPQAPGGQPAAGGGWASPQHAGLHHARPAHGPVPYGVTDQTIHLDLEQCETREIRQAISKITKVLESRLEAYERNNQKMVGILRRWDEEAAAHDPAAMHPHNAPVPHASPAPPGGDHTAEAAQYFAGYQPALNQYPGQPQPAGMPPRTGSPSQYPGQPQPAGLPPRTGSPSQYPGQPQPAMMHAQSQYTAAPQTPQPAGVPHTPSAYPGQQPALHHTPSAYPAQQPAMSQAPSAYAGGRSSPLPAYAGQQPAPSVYPAAGMGAAPQPHLSQPGLPHAQSTIPGLQHAQSTYTQQPHG